ncbi:hypothetical protein QFC22_002423 [Naganishia vaughanmartiniae]|uniref:Uncharacterized protein n=1 Tax=Naganishia vaughanmartiniae TaxID=1424756 RepID=A0ACC2XEI2_9TREE|nr:hypothetical protein QFC22_002423 [Naganishia vaughanmartiniae]
MGPAGFKTTGGRTTQPTSRSCDIGGFTSRSQLRYLGKIAVWSPNTLDNTLPERFNREDPARLLVDAAQALEAEHNNAPQETQSSALPRRSYRGI